MQPAWHYALIMLPPDNMLFCEPKRPVLASNYARFGFQLRPYWNAKRPKFYIRNLEFIEISNTFARNNNPMLICQGVKI